MIKPTVILTWPIHIDFPLFRYNLERFKDYFENVVITFSNINQQESYRSYIVKDLPFATFVGNTGDKKDWRDDAVNLALDKAPSASWYLFMEQDFLIRDVRFFEVVLNTPHEYNFVYFKEDTRIHPGFVLVNGDLVRKTSRDFAANPPAWDHFGKFFRELGDLTEGVDIETLGLRAKVDYYHLAGLTQNYACFKNNQPFYKPDEFLTYNMETLELMQHQYVTLPENFMKMCLEISVKEGVGSSLEGKNEFIRDFFPPGVKKDV